MSGRRQRREASCAGLSSPRRSIRARRGAPFPSRDRSAKKGASLGKAFMIIAMRAVLMTATCVSVALSLSACQSFLPRDDTHVTLPALAAAPGVASSGQKLDDEGYPMIGHKPRAARAQASDDAVQATEQRYSRVEARAGGNPEAGYRRDVAELEALAARQQAEAARVLTPPRRHRPTQPAAGAIERRRPPLRSMRPAPADAPCLSPFGRRPRGGVVQSMRPAEGPHP